MNRKIHRLTLVSAFIAAGQAIAVWPAHAAVVGLECRRDGDPGKLFYWIDLEKKTITSAYAPPAGVVDPSTLQTHPVTITPEAFSFNTSMGPSTISRMFGLNTNPVGTPYQCAASTQTTPAGKF